MGEESVKNKLNSENKAKVSQYPRWQSRALRQVTDNNMVLERSEQSLIISCIWLVKRLERRNCAKKEVLSSRNRRGKEEGIEESQKFF